MKKILIIIVFIFVFKDYVFASDAPDSLNIEQYDTIINNGGSYTEYSFSKTVKSILSGEGIDFNISSIIQKTISIVFKEVFLNSKIIKNVILIAFLSAFLKVLTESFKNQGVSELGFYTSYMVVAMLIVNSFNIGVGIVSDTISIVSNIINSIMPMLVGLLFMSGAGASATLFSTFIISTLKLLSFLIYYYNVRSTFCQWQKTPSLFIREKGDATQQIRGEEAGVSWIPRRWTRTGRAWLCVWQHCAIYQRIG